MEFRILLYRSALGQIIIFFTIHTLSMPWRWLVRQTPEFYRDLFLGIPCSYHRSQPRYNCLQISEVRYIVPLTLRSCLIVNSNPSYKTNPSLKPTASLDIWEDLFIFSTHQGGPLPLPTWLYTALSTRSPNQQRLFCRGFRIVATFLSEACFAVYFGRFNFQSEKALKLHKWDANEKMPRPCK